MTSIVHVLRHRQRRYKPRQYFQRANLIEQYSNDKLYAHYRFRREDILCICDILRPHLQRPTRRSHALTVEEQVLIALRFFACGSFYEVIADGLVVTVYSGTRNAFSGISPGWSNSSVCEISG